MVLVHTKMHLTCVRSGWKQKTLNFKPWSKSGACGMRSVPWLWQKQLHVLFSFSHPTFGAVQVLFPPNIVSAQCSTIHSVSGYKPQIEFLDAEIARMVTMAPTCRRLASTAVQVPFLSRQLNTRCHLCAAAKSLVLTI